jgi:hypothetical protein
MIKLEKYGGEHIFWAKIQKLREKIWKKVLALVLALIMVLAMGVTSFAAMHSPRSRRASSLAPIGISPGFAFSGMSTMKTS